MSPPEYRLLSRDISTVDPIQPRHGPLKLSITSPRQPRVRRAIPARHLSVGLESRFGEQIIVIV